MKFPIVVVLDNIRSALNVGAIFRTCDGAGTEKLYLCGITPYPPHNRIPKTALGAIEYVNWEYERDTIKVCNRLKKEGYTLIAVEQTQKSINYTKSLLKKNKKYAFIFGNEVNGIEKSVLGVSDIFVEIPMQGDKTSLNVATTVGIILFDALRQLS